MYCDGRDSGSRHAALSTMLHVTRAITSVLAPVLPHVCHEVATCAPVLASPLEAGWSCDEEWGQEPGLGEVMASLERLREELNKRPEVRPSESELEISLRPEIAGRLEAVPPDQVAEVLGVLRVRITPGDSDSVLQMSRSLYDICVRCRRRTAPSGQELCGRCDDVVRELDS